MIAFFKNVGRELKKVTWPKGKELTNYTVTVIITVLFMALFFFLVDLGVSQLIEVFFE